MASVASKVNDIEKKFKNKVRTFSNWFTFEK